MLRFFRLIRKKLIEEENARKYFWYALGEILLVVIGILIAVQVNLALESSRNEVSKEQMLLGLQKEFEENLIQLDTVLYYHQLTVDTGNELIVMISEPESYKERERIEELLAGNGWLWTFDPNDGVLKSSISAGDIHFIKSDSLKTILFSWETKVRDAKEEEFRAVTQYQDFLLPYLEKRISLGNTVDLYSDEIPKSSFNSDYSMIMKDPLFENLLLSRSIYALDAIVELNSLYALNQTVLRLIDKELN